MPAADAILTDAPQPGRTTLGTIPIAGLSADQLAALSAQGWQPMGDVMVPRGSSAAVGPVDPITTGIANGSINLADYAAAMGVGGPPPGSPANSIVAPDSQAARDNAGPPDVPLGGPGTPGYTGNPPPPDPGPPGFRDTDGNGIDDREQTTVGPTSFGLPYGQMQGMPTLPTGWGSAINTGMGGFIPADGGGASLGGYGGDMGGYPSSGTGGAAGGPASGGNFTVPGSGTAPFTPGAPPTSSLPDVSQIGVGVTGGGSAGGAMGWPDFQNPLTGTGAGAGTTANVGTGSTGGGAVTATGSPSGSSGLVQNLAGSYQGAIDSANAANENRFASGLELLLKRAEQAGQAIQGLNYEGMNDIGRMFGQQRARADQDLINRGLANTTVREGVMRGYATDEQAARNRYADEQVRQNIDENYRQQGDLANWIGARNDVGPDMGQLANLASGVGAAGPQASNTQSSGASTTSGGTASTSSLPPPVGNVVNNPVNAQGQRVDVSVDAQGNTTQSVGGQQLSGPSQSSSGVLTRSAPSSSAPQSATSQPSAEQLWANSGWAQNANNLVSRYVSGSGGGQRPEFSDPLGQAANPNRTTPYDSNAAPQQQQQAQNQQAVQSLIQQNLADFRGLRPGNPGYDAAYADAMRLNGIDQPSQQSPSTLLSGYGGSGGTQSSSEPLSAGSNSGVSTGQRTGGTLQTGPMNAPPPSMPGLAGGAMIRNGQVDQNTVDNPLAYGSITGVPQNTAGTLRTGNIQSPPPGRFEEPPPSAMPTGAASPPPVLNYFSGSRGANGSPSTESWITESNSMSGMAPMSGSQLLLGVMGNYGSSPSGATPPSQPPASPLTGSPARALVDNNQPMASAGQTPAPFSAASLYTALPQNAALWGNPTGPMNPMVMQNGQMTPATFLPSLGRYGVLA